jgi:uncharacterized protein YecT (DUF1311 family)
MLSYFTRQLLISIILMAPIGLAMSASFDCKRARAPLEKLICSDPKLDAADAEMGAVYRRVRASFPLRNFITLTQQAFVQNYPFCLRKTGDISSNSNASAVRRCLDLVEQRTQELREFATADVFSRVKGEFTHDNLIILKFLRDGRPMVRMWGNWMPDAYNPAPFPEGWLCDIEELLIPRNGSFEIGREPILNFNVSGVHISDFISCSPRTGIDHGTYPRLR